MQETREFTPAAGSAAGVERYDMLIRLFTRERAWRTKLIERIALLPGQTMVEVGCGTGTLSILLKQRCPAARIIAIDPDDKVLDIARAKAAKAGAEIDFRLGFLDQQGIEPGSIDEIVCSLVLHQVSIETKHAIVSQMLDCLKDAGRLHIADYARQTGAMRWLFRQTVQRADGVADTQPNADGLLEAVLKTPAFVQTQDDLRIATPSGAITIFSREKRITQGMRKSR